MIGIYGFHDTINNKWYVGQSLDVERRIKQHYKNISLDDVNSFDYFLHKVGIENFEVKILKKCTQEELNDNEKYYVELYDAYNNGYNRTAGGQQWAKHYKITEAHREALKKSWTEERRAKAKITQSKLQKEFYQTERGKLMAKKHGDQIRGTKASEEAKRKMSESRKGHLTSEETKQKISIANKGRKHNEVSRKHMSDAHLGKSPGNKGKKFVWNNPLDHSKGFHYIDKNTDKNKDEE